MLRKVDLTKECVNYIKQELSQGGDLSVEASNLLLQSGFMFTYIPFSMSLTTQIDFSESLEFLSGELVFDEFISIIKEIILKTLDKNPHIVAIFETIWSENDEVTLHSALQYFTIKGRRYDYLKGGDEKIVLDDYIADAQGYPTVIFIVNNQNSDFEIRNKSKFHEGYINELVKRIEVMIVGAFDGEGYIIWHKV